MDEQELKSLLRRADATASPPRITPELGPRVRRLAMRRRILATAGRVAIAASLGLLAGTAAWWFISGRGGDGGVTPTIAEDPRPAPVVDENDPDLLLARVTQLEAELASRLAAEKAFRAGRERRARLATLERKLAESNPLGDAHLELEKTACFLVREADRLCTGKGRPDACLAAYQRVVKFFPRTYAAVQARQKITEIQTGKGGLS